MRNTYSSCSVVFIQEAASNFSDDEAGRSLADSHDLLQPQIRDHKRNQNSLILVRKGFLNKGGTKEITEIVLKHAHSLAPNNRAGACPCPCPCPCPLLSVMLLACVRACTKRSKLLGKSKIPSSLLQPPVRGGPCKLRAA